MFVINLNYIVPLVTLDAHMADHVAFLRKYYAKNVFVASGRKVPRTGGIILALAKSKEEVEKSSLKIPFINISLLNSQSQSSSLPNIILTSRSF